jgi:hypothetical protein
MEPPGLQKASPHARLAVVKGLTLVALHSTFSLLVGNNNLPSATTDSRQRYALKLHFRQDYA